MILNTIAVCDSAAPYECRAIERSSRFPYTICYLSGAAVDEGYIIMHHGLPSRKISLSIRHIFPAVYKFSSMRHEEAGTLDHIANQLLNV
jgi:hypothetical protein